MAEIECLVHGGIELVSPPAKALERLRRELSFPHPEFAKALMRGLPTAGVPERWHATIECPESLIIPRGAIKVLKRTLAIDDHVPKFVDRRVLGAPISVPQFVCELRDYQKEGVHGVWQNTQGIAILPCGGGKTTIGAGAIYRIAQPTLVLVHTEDLLNQWARTVEERLGIEPGFVKAGKMKLARVTIGMIDSVANLIAELPGVANLFGFVILDEAHHAPASTFQSLLYKLPARYRLGLTATPEREDGLGPAVDWAFGERVTERSVAQLIARGWLMSPIVEAVVSDFEFEWNGPDTRKNHALDVALVGCESRNKLIERIARADAKAGETILILSSRKAQLEKLHELVPELSMVVTSDTGKATRKDLLRTFSEGSLPILLATQLADEGLDIPRLSRIVLAFPERAKGKTIQRVGRLMRTFPQKNPRLYDIVDTRVPTLKDRWHARRRTFKKLGLEVFEPKAV